MSKQNTIMSSSQQFDLFKIGDDVEVTSSDHSLRGTLFLAKVIGKKAGTSSSSPSTKSRNKLIVQYVYSNNNDDEEEININRILVKDEVDIALVRPLPPCERNYGFKFGDNVDAFFDDGWWEGWITAIIEGEEENVKYKVYFRATKKQLVFEKSRLRLHREWMNGEWVPPLRQDDQAAVTTEKDEKADSTFKFSNGTRVEVRNDEDGFQGAWFAATIVKSLGKDKYEIKYEMLRTEDDKDFVTEMTDENHIRPYPPDHAVVVDSFSIGDKVDALFQDGWWEGEIIKILRGGKYRVYFEGTGDKADFMDYELRVHQSWINGTWVV